MLSSGSLHKFWSVKTGVFGLLLLIILLQFPFPSFFVKFDHTVLKHYLSALRVNESSHNQIYISLCTFFTLSSIHPCTSIYVRRVHFSLYKICKRASKHPMICPVTA